LYVKDLLLERNNSDDDDNLPQVLQRKGTLTVKRLFTVKVPSLGEISDRFLFFKIYIKRDKIPKKKTKILTKN
jgi:hypothetical protein